MDAEFDLDLFESWPEAQGSYCALISPDSDNLTTPSDHERYSACDSRGSPYLLGEGAHTSVGFTPEEDTLLRQLVVEFDCDWPRIARALPSKTPAQVAKRWTCKLDPSIKKTKWSAEEDKQIEALQQSFGNNWKLIARHLPGRPPAAIKSRYYNSIRKRGCCRDFRDLKPFEAAPERSISPMSLHFESLELSAPLQMTDKESRITTLRKQLAGMEVLMAKTKAEISRLQESRRSEAE